MKNKTGTGKQVKLRYQMRGLGIGIFVTALLMGVATKEGRPLTDAEIRAKAYELGMVDEDSVTLTDFKGGTPGPQGTMPPQGTIPPRESASPQGTVPPRESAVPQGTTPPQGSAAPEVTAEPLITASPDQTATPGGTAAPGRTANPGGTAAPGQTANPGGTAEPGQTVNSGARAAPSQETPSMATASPEPTAPAADPTSKPPSGNDGTGEAVTVIIRRGSNSYSVSVQLAEAGLVENASEFDTYLCGNGYAGKIRTGTYQIVPGASWEQIAEIIAGNG